ncbi:XRE family transcriptional regulator [Prosthecomicrobium hirschii]|uniref:XRE family transcriptional regulator n=1 Tax=Prosthecodimorpha hirschii TaxID=665126 RepID=A0A0P6VPN8_9HYPH|nr:helix-turn-helix transcriptional regulator [Prosthecomicrobium hirschii]KPL53176.1 XRE family transcriptional regulator [Prosthecomicrobium hirschii]
MSFGERIRGRRIELDIGLNDFADRIGCSPAYWSRIERDKEKPPRDELIERAAAILGLTLDELFIRAERLPPDMQRELGRVVIAYRRFRAVGQR